MIRSAITQAALLMTSATFAQSTPTGASVEFNGMQL